MDRADELRRECRKLTRGNAESFDYKRAARLLGECGADMKKFGDLFCVQFWIFERIANGKDPVEAVDQIHLNAVTTVRPLHHWFRSVRPPAAASR